MYTTLLALDICGYGDRHKSVADQIYLHETMYEKWTTACAMTGLKQASFSHEDRGDGAFVIMPPDVNPDRLLDPIAHHLSALLRRGNQGAGRTRQLRLRMAVHQGEVYHDTHGITGHASVHLFRILNAPKFKKTMRTTRSDLGMIVSDNLYTAVSQRGGLLNPNAYRPIRLSCKETRRTRAWLWLPPDSR